MDASSDSSKGHDSDANSSYEGSRQDKIITIVHSAVPPSQKQYSENVGLENLTPADIKYHFQKKKSILKPFDPKSILVHELKEEDTSAHLSHEEVAVKDQIMERQDVTLNATSVAAPTSKRVSKFKQSRNK